MCRTLVHCGIWQAMREATKGIAKEKEIKPNGTKINESAARNDKCLTKEDCILEIGPAAQFFTNRHVSILD